MMKRTHRMVQLRAATVGGGSIKAPCQLYVSERDDKAVRALVATETRDCARTKAQQAFV